MRAGPVRTAGTPVTGLVAVLLLAAAVVAGCADQSGRSLPDAVSGPISSGSDTSYRKPPVLSPPQRLWRSGQFTPSVVWRGDRLIVRVYGSSTCRPVARSALVLPGNRLIVTFERQAPGQGCTADYAPNRSTIAAPTQGVDLSQDVYAAPSPNGIRHGWVKVETVRPRLG